MLVPNFKILVSVDFRIINWIVQISNEKYWNFNYNFSNFKSLNWNSIVNLRILLVIFDFQLKIIEFILKIFGFLLKFYEFQIISRILIGILRTTPQYGVNRVGIIPFSKGLFCFNFVSLEMLYFTKDIRILRCYSKMFQFNFVKYQFKFEKNKLGNFNEISKFSNKKIRISIII